MLAIVSRAAEGIYQICRGLWTVFKHSGRPPTTKEYPDIMPDLPGAFRGRLALTVNPETGEHLCISCRQCERVCPDKCIDITAHKSPETGKLELIDFKIDHGLCMFCGLCTEVCPTTCIINTNDFEMSDYSRQALIYDLKRLTLTKEESAFYFNKKDLPLPKPKPKPAAKPAAGKPAEDKAGGAAEAQTVKPAGDAGSAQARPVKPEGNKPSATAENKAAGSTGEKEGSRHDKPAARSEEGKNSTTEE